jgi:hypothetical protein
MRQQPFDEPSFPLPEDVGSGRFEHQLVRRSDSEFPFPCVVAHGTAMTFRAARKGWHPVEFFGL